MTEKDFKQQADLVLSAPQTDLLYGNEVKEEVQTLSSWIASSGRLCVWLMLLIFSLDN